jgi:uncharacterized protein YyaL (SSP411 family)
VVRRLSKQPVGPSAAITAELLDAAARNLRASYDGIHGGFGGAPKFPPSMVLEFLLRHSARTGAGLDLVEHTCRAMASGGMYDQLAGGFARYSVDAQWVVPHFEKMLYDNALLLRVYTHLWRATGEPGARRVALETADFLLRDLRTEQGGFASALDADTAGEEGLTYVWTPAQLLDALGDEDGRWAVEQFDVTERGTFEHGSSVLQRLAEPDDAGATSGSAPGCARCVRSARSPAGTTRWWPPGTAWPSRRSPRRVRCSTGRTWWPAADACADLLGPAALDRRPAAAHVDRRPAGRHAGVLEDYADVAEGLLALCSVTGDVRRLAAAAGLLDVVLDHFADGHGGFYDTADDAEQLVSRPQDPTDGPAPSGLAAAAGALLTCAAMTGEQRYRDAAEDALGTVAPLMDPARPLRRLGGRGG